MRTKRRFVQNAIRLLLLSILLAAQTLSFAHEVSHLATGDAELCEVCRVQSSSPVISSLEQSDFAVSPAVCLPVQYHSQISGIVRLSNIHPRAPPRFL